MARIELKRSFSSLRRLQISISRVFGGICRRLSRKSFGMSDWPSEMWGWMQIQTPKRLPQDCAIGEQESGESLQQNGRERLPSLDVLVSLHECDEYIAEHLHQARSLLAWDGLTLNYFLSNESPYVRRLVQEFKETSGKKVRIIDPAEPMNLYSAWNEMILNSDGDLLCNWNVDDGRGPKSFLRMAQLALEVPKADIWFADFYLSVQKNLGWGLTQDKCPTSSLHFSSSYTMINLLATPHAFVMWRRDLHRTLGLFGEFTSAGDLDFWVRATVAGKRTYYHAEPLYSYFLNPAGLSTSTKTRKVALREIANIQTRFRELQDDQVSLEDLWQKLRENVTTKSYYD